MHFGGTAIIKSSSQNVGSKRFPRAAASMEVDSNWIREDVLSGLPNEKGQADAPLHTPT